MRFLLIFRTRCSTAVRCWEDTLALLAQGRKDRPRSLRRANSCAPATAARRDAWSRKDKHSPPFQEASGNSGAPPFRKQQQQKEEEEK